ncbi:hypothetical protein ABGB12_29785 [Actinocorallia sp. B10E7]|uniref:phosphotriesterase family protein n=1 Tax=Actinocorallia sp. B10E7 TaxID=3153558 RepID=UPI00325CDF35
MTLMSVLGPVEESELGRVLVHEHVRVAFAGWDLDPRGTIGRDEEIATAVGRMRELQEFGVRTFVDPCPIELGRDVTLLKEVSERTGMHIVAATGFYHEEDGMGIPYYWRMRWVEEIAELYLHEIQNGIDGTGIRPGVIKTATSKPVGRHDLKILAATGIAARESGLAVITHTTHAAGVEEQLEAFEKAGVDPSRCLIGHQDEQKDYDVLLKIVERGHFVGFDRIGISRLAADEHRADNIARLVRDGYAGQICLSQDHMCYDAHPRPAYWIPPNRAEEVFRDIKPVADEELWGRSHTYMFTSFFPLLHERGVSQEEIDLMLTENAVRLLTGK